MRTLCFMLALAVVLPLQASASRGTFLLPELPEPAVYGNLLLDSVSSANGMRPVVFSHWVHRQHVTCSVCHEELDFVMEAGATGINKTANRQGRFCGTCHNGDKAFSLKDMAHCHKCHSNDMGYSRDTFDQFSQEYFPATPFGNRIDWGQAIREGLITPVNSLNHTRQQMNFNERLPLDAEWNFVSKAVFPHREHVEWMNCSMCHPDLFNIKKKTTRHFQMSEILKGNFCGFCHLNVAFPIDDCQRCHPGMD